MPQKRCRTCHQEKAPGQFYRNTRTKDGLESSCKECRKKAARQRPRNPLLISRGSTERTRRWRLENPERARALRRAQYERDKVDPRYREALKVRYWKYRERRLEYSRRYYQRHREEILARLRERRKQRAEAS